MSYTVAWKAFFHQSVTVVGTMLCSGIQVMHVLRTLHLFASQFDSGVDQNDSNLRRR